MFQFNGNLYEQVDGVAMGSPLGPLMAYAFMCSIEERLLNQGEMPNFYKRRYVDDTFSIMPNVETAEAFLSTLNDSHPSISFTELATNGKLPFLGGGNRETHVLPGDKGVQKADGYWIIIALSKSCRCAI